MTMPPEQTDGGVQTQVLITLGKLETGQAVTNTKLDQVLSQQSDQETRIRGLESAKAKIYGAGITAGVLSGAAAGVIVWALGRH